MRVVYLFLFLFLTLIPAAWCDAQSLKNLDAKKLKSIETSTPASLPQEPVVPKECSDAEDEEIKGKVMSVTGESQDISEPGSGETKHLSYIERFNEKGNFIKQISFDSEGNPSDITVYGWLDGARVSKTKSITYDYNPPPVMAPPAAAKPATKPRDVRISYSYTYKYVEGKLSEMQMYYNDGRPGMRYTYTRTGNTLEKLAFDDKGQLNQKYVYRLDKDGNEVEDLRIDLTPQRYYGDKKFIFKYDSFDKNGNWTKRTASQIHTVNGKEIAKPAFVHFRTFEYFK